MEKEKNHNPISLLNEMVSEPYYLFHFLAFFSYIPVRCSASQVLSPHFTSHLLHREIQAALAFCVLAVVKMVKEETWEAFIADTLFFAKIFLVAIALVMDYHLAIWYMLVFLVIYTLTHQPAHRGLGTSNQLTPLQLEALLTEGNTSRFWLVEFRALSSSICVRTSRFFPELSITYSNKNLSFGIVDLGLFPNVAGKFGISLGSTGQLPMYLLFENGVEVTRFPEVDFEAKTSNPPLTKKFLCQHFELDRHLLEYISGK
uniref:Putative thioredoxin-related transmembrane protein 2 n=1 Tax=Davidia involucrata TaxID=16924 RepID=A0A5B7BV24_DAVIN